MQFKHSVVILNNCSIHHVEGIVEMIEEAGARISIPYSPDLNAIEETFSKVKAKMSNQNESMADVLTLKP